MFGRTRPKTARRRLGTVVALTSAIAVAGSLTASPALADDPVEIPVSYTVTGKTTVKKTGGTLDLGPGQLNGALVIDGDNVGIRGDLSLPPATANISLVSGVFKIKARVRIQPTGPVTGTLANGDLTTHSQANMLIDNIVVGLFYPVIPLPTVPNACKTVKPLDLTLVSKNVDLFAEVIPSSGVFTIPEFKDCFINDLALGALISGPGNTINLNLKSNV
ncbi:hypothetical protein [Amycolatopsis azurea]|uniref:Secreted protein n=1 Tax=Amycolatopsis azurea DSM 43854 TaxID=1238180 RepID=M2QFI0_9PSEU|nr:hypothetical protein [Amycolatopsis azurea]EMD25481.1 hypothetical protein C791_4728 [Amycolatopsis azurea DSM 43854]OOC00694.1 hypothetical protein B0293_41790 [Amycolatopsis azurea DSM 43854]